MKISEERKNIFGSLHTFRTKVKQPAKDVENPFFKKKYVDLSGVVKSIDEAIEGLGLSYTQQVTSENNSVSVVTCIFHSSGEFIEFDPLKVPTLKNDAQSLGSAMTYAKRYSLSSAFGITSDDDDDGNEATGRNNDQNNNDKRNYGKSTPQSEGTKKASESQLNIALDQTDEFAKSQGVTIQEVTTRLFPTLNIKSQLSELTFEEYQVLIKYYVAKRMEKNNDK